MSSDLPLVIRPATDGDVNFILNSWLKSYASSPWFDALGNDAYWITQRDAIIELIGSSDTMVACSEEDPNVIVGWSCSYGNHVHYVYVKKAFRGIGVAKQLIGDLTLKACVYTHKTYTTAKTRLPSRWTYRLFVPNGAK